MSEPAANGGRIIAAGIDLGGTKIEAQLFDAGWRRVDSRRIPTPQDYADLVAALADLVAWADGFAPALPVGIAAAGLVHPVTGIALTANLAATGHPFPADIASAAGRPVTYVNDCRAQALSEAQFGAARGHATALTLNLGTGLAGGIVVNGRLLQGPSGTGGEFGHFALPAHLMRDLPLVRCGCGRTGCTETLIAGPGLSRLAAHRTGRSLSAEEIVAGRAADPALAAVWTTWLGLLAELVHTLVMVVDPGCVVLAGGLSRAPGLVADLVRALTAIALPGYGAPPILLAEGGATTGARGAAFAAFTAGETAG